MIFFKIASPRTKGLKSATLFTYSGIDSRGRIVPEKNKNKLPTEKAANTTVSSDLNKYPKSIPNEINNVLSKKIDTDVFNNTENKFSLKKYRPTPKIIASCMNIIIKF